MTGPSRPRAAPSLNSYRRNAPTTEAGATKARDPMNLSRHHVVALVGATLTSAIALSDAILHGLTGSNSIFSDGSGHPGWIVAGGLVHGLTYAALTWVLIRESARFHRANRLVRTLRYVLIGSLVALAAGFIIVAPIVVMANVPPSSPLGIAWV